jgi:hypothetical protein
MSSFKLHGFGRLAPKQGASEAGQLLRGGDLEFAAAQARPQDQGGALHQVLGSDVGPQRTADVLVRHAVKRGRDRDEQTLEGALVATADAADDCQVAAGGS